jgi:hypothetical protein
MSGSAIELAVAVALLAAIEVTLSAWPLSSGASRAAASAQLLASRVAQARWLASNAAGANANGVTAQFEASGTGATIVTLYLDRPIAAFAAGGGAALVPVPGVLPLDLGARVALQLPGGALAQAPFAAFIAPSGHASAAPGDWSPDAAGRSAPLATEPPCGAVLSVAAGTASAVRSLSCEAAALR